LSSDPTLSPFVTARVSSDSDSDSSSTPREEQGSDDPSPEQLHPEDPVLTAQLQYGLDIQDREPENPLTPDKPAYQQLIEDAVEAGLNVPPPPPIAQPVLQLLALQPIQNIMAAPAPAPQTGRLRGQQPDDFTRDRALTRKFKQQFKVYWNLNDNYEVMQVPYYRVMQALSLIKGPLVDDWKDDQIDSLIEKTSRAAYPIGKDNPVLWNEFQTAFDTAFSDTTAKQKAHAAIQTLEMQGKDLDGYIATFKHLAKEAGYTLDAEGTIQLFAHGLPKGLASAIMYCDNQPGTMDEWITATQTELQKFAHRQAFINPRYMKYQWVRPTADTGNNNNKRLTHRRRHPNDEVVPMDVDPPVYTNL